MSNPFGGNPFGGTATQAPPAVPVTQPRDPFAGQASVGAGEDPFGAPRPPRGNAPAIADLYGCLLLISPHKLEEGIASRFKDDKGNAVVQDRMTADIVVLDGGEHPNGQVPWGGKPYAQNPAERRPHDRVFITPDKIGGAYISQKALVSQLSDALAVYRAKGAGQVGTMVLGRLAQGQVGSNGGNPPWILSAFDTLTDADKQKARAWLAAHPVDQFGAPR